MSCHRKKSCSKKESKHHHHCECDCDYYPQSYCPSPCPPPYPPYPPYPPQPPVPPVNTCKTIALLNLTGDGVISINTNLKLTFEYYFKFSNQFKKFPIIDDKSDIHYLLYLLNYYYTQGYRIFIGFTTSTTVAAVLPWFEAHPDAIGISTNSTSPTLDIPKNIYRILPNDTVILDSLETNPFINSRRSIYYVYSDDEISALSIKAALESEYGSKVKSFSATSSNLTKTSLQDFFIGCDPLQDITILYLFNGEERSTYIELFVPPITVPVIPTFDISLNEYPIFSPAEKLVWNGLYSCWQNIGFSTSELWRNGQTYLGSNFNYEALNVLQLNKTLLLNNKQTEEISNYAWVQEFDPITKDAIYFCYSNWNYLNDIWNREFIVGIDPIFGPFSKDF